METYGGIGVLENLLTGVTAPVAFDAAHARIGIGDGNGAVPTPNPADTGLTATTNKAFLSMNTGYPQLNGTSMIWQGTATSTQANFAWNEWIIDNGNASGPAVALNHKGVAMGTKSSGTTWTFNATLTQS